MSEGVSSAGGGNGATSFASIEDELRTSYLAYSMSVIVGRALPDARDGLKPVHRRILYTMHEMGNRPSAPYKKSARVIGDAMGKYHPHGDSALYDALVRMAQDFSMRYPLIDGQGNFGSVDGDPAAAMRYTEVRLHRMAEQLLADLEKETVDFVPTYNDEMEEPRVLPSRVPNLLLNGSDGIAVGMATKIPPHNLGELTTALLHLIDKPDASLGELIDLIPGPDFPTAGFIMGRAGIVEAYKSGKGTVRMRARVEIEVDKKERAHIVATELPYQVNKARLLTHIADLVRSKRIEGIADIRDESDREEGVRAVISLKRDANPQVVLNNLYKHTELQQNYGVNMVALVGGRPKLLNLRELLQCFLEHRREVVSRRTAFELRQAEARAHILEGLKIAVDNIDEVVALIRRSQDIGEARAGLTERFELSLAQANAVLDMRLARLTGLERGKIVDELRDLYMKIERLNSVLADEALLMALIADELRETNKEFGDPRRTEIVDLDETIVDEDLIEEESMAITVTQAGYVKRTPLSAYRRQGRGGKGVAGLKTRTEDIVVDLFVASTHAFLLIVTDRGRAFAKRVFELPKGSRIAKGKPIVNLIPLESGERVAAFLPVAEFVDGRYLVMVTRDGLVKKTDLMAYARIRRTGIRAISLVEGDELIAARLTDGDDEVFIGTAEGMSIRFREEQIRPMGRVSRGVRGIQLREGDRVVSMSSASRGEYVFTVCEAGYGKRTRISEYSTQNRGGLGIITIKTSDRNGKVVAMPVVDATNEAVIVTSSGKMIRFAISEASIQGRNTQGVRLVSLSPGESVVAVAKVIHDEEDEAAEEVPADMAVVGASTAAVDRADQPDHDTDPDAEPLAPVDADAPPGGEITDDTDPESVPLPSDDGGEDAGGGDDG